MKNELSQIIKSEKKLILKGDKNNLLSKYSLKERDYRGERFKDHSINLDGFCEVLSITKPEIISEIYERYLKAGVDIIATNSLLGNRLALAEYSLDEYTYEINLASAKLARDKVTKYTSITWDKPRFAAGSISNIKSEVDFDHAKSIYSEQIKALFAGKIDFLVFNKISDEVSLLASLEAYNDLMIRRKKTGDLILIVKSDELESIIIKEGFAQKYSNLNFVAVGYAVDVHDDNFVEKFETLKTIYPINICSLIDETEADEDRKAKEIVELLKLMDNIKIIGFEDNFSPDFIKEVVDNLS